MVADPRGRVSRVYPSRGKRKKKENHESIRKNPDVGLKVDMHLYFSEVGTSTMCVHLPDLDRHHYAIKSTGQEPEACQNENIDAGILFS